MCVTEHLLHSWQGYRRSRQAVHKEAAGRERKNTRETDAGPLGNRSRMGLDDKRDDSLPSAHVPQQGSSLYQT